MLNEVIPSSEMARYTKGGGEANAVAARIARGTTGRDLIRFSGYHGWHDWYQSANYLVDPEKRRVPFCRDRADRRAKGIGRHRDSLCMG